jgi:acyl dehydratase
VQGLNKLKLLRLIILELRFGTILEGDSMEISSRIVGLKLKEYTADVTWRQTTNYASSVSDVNPFYFDDTREDGVIAPPMFASTFAWSVMGKLTENANLPYPKEVFNTLVHYTEHFDFFKPVRPGDRITVKGEIAAVAPHRSGTLLVAKLPAFDDQGVPVFIGHMGVLLRGVGCSDCGAGSERLPVVPKPKDNTVPVWETQIPIYRETPYIYDGCTDIVFAIHTSPKFARLVGLPDIILHGTATMAFVSREIINREANADPTMLKCIAGRFTGMVMPGSTIHVQLLQRGPKDESMEVFFVVTDGQGKNVISDGYAKL